MRVNGMMIGFTSLYDYIRIKTPTGGEKWWLSPRGKCYLPRWSIFLKERGDNKPGEFGIQMENSTGPIKSKSPYLRASTLK
jgi:hypothetical protein